LIKIVQNGFRKKFYFAAAILLIGSAAGAETRSSTTTTEPLIQNDGMASVGVHMGFKPLLSEEVDGTLLMESFSSTTRAIESSTGVTFGYSTADEKLLGWSTDLTYAETLNEGFNSYILRADGNLEYALSNMYKIKCGVNLSKVTMGADMEDVNPSLGYQASVAAKWKENTEVELGLYQLSPSIANGVDISSETCIAVGLTGTF
jgi:hypothetical protein